MGNFIYKRWLLFSVAWLSSFLLLLLLLLINNTENILLACITIIFIAISVYLVYGFVRHQKIELNKYLQTLKYRIKNAGDNALKSLPIGIILYNRQGVINWYNSFIQQMIGNKKGIGQHIDELFPNLQKTLDTNSTGEYVFQENVYSVEHDETERLFYFKDITELQALKQCIYEDRLVIGFIHLDNLDEVEHVLSDQEENHVITNIYNSILKWGADYNFSVKKLDADKLLLIMLNKTLEQLINAKFDILDTVREVNKKSKIPITLSIGLSSEGTESVTLAQNAQNALEIAMARGGDQVAVRKQNKVLFFGGKTNALEKRTRVKARMVSSAISNLLQESEWVIIMGHTNTDMDSLGAAIGMARFAKLYNCNSYIVLDELNPSIERLVEAIEEHDYLGGRLITRDVALDLANQDGMLLIVVDTHRPSFVIEPQLLKKINKIVVLDHHRRGEDFVDNAVLVYIEPYASSTCELVSELLQYQERDLEMDPLEATALLAGIVVDTQNFVARAGSRTFEAASFLRRHGADLTMVQMLLKEDLAQYLQRAQLIKTAVIIQKSIALAVADQNEQYDQVLIAQAADTLLKMKDITASFVVAVRQDDRIAISARSHGDLNVQLIMEELGGGGHLTNAACQLKNKSIQEVKETLLGIIYEHIKGVDY